MLESIVLIISILSAFSLFVPVFSGYFLAVMMLVLAFFCRFGSKSPSELQTRDRFRLAFRGVSSCTLIFAGLCGISVLYVSLDADAPDKHLFRAFLDFLVKHVVLWFVYLNFWWRFAANLRLRRQFAIALAFFSIVHLTYCLVQRSLGLDWAHGFSALLPENRLSSGVYRISGFMGHPLTLGYCQAIAAAAALGMGLKSFNRWEMFAWLITCLAATTVVLVSGSRGPQLTLLIGLVVHFSFADILKRWRLILIAIVPLALIAVKLKLFSRFLELTNSNFGGDIRLVHWSVYLRAFLDHPIFGVGPGGHNRAISSYYLSAGASDNIRSAHNAFLQYAAEYGSVGLFGLFVLVISWLKLAYGVTRVARPIVSIVLVTIVASLSQNVLQDSEYILAFTVWFMFLMTVEVENSESPSTGRTKAQDSISAESGETA